MLTRPLSYKGPVDHLSQYFSDQLLMQGLDILLEDNLVNWQHMKDEGYVKGTCLVDGQFSKQTLDWPIVDALGSCSCDAAFPCAHLAAVAIESKMRLHRLPPAIKKQKQLLTGKRYIQNWLQGQILDPYPKMARHRVIYLLANKEGDWVVSVYKAYMTKKASTNPRLPGESISYQSKTELNIEEAIEQEISKAKGTKFYSLIDLRILFLLKQKFGVDRSQLKFQSETKPYQFIIQDRKMDGRIIKLLARTGRLFWQSSHRSPLALSTTSAMLGQNTATMEKLTRHYFLDKKQNVIQAIFEQATGRSKNVWQELTTTDISTIRPCLKVTSTENAMPWEKGKVYQFDVAKLSFLVGGTPYSLKNLLPLILEKEVNREFTMKIAEFLTQIENLPVLEAKFEIPVVEDFHFGDREFDPNLSHMLPILAGLHQLGWKLEIEKGFRLNQLAVQEWYVEVNQGNDESSLSDDSFIEDDQELENEDNTTKRPTQLDLLAETDPPPPPTLANEDDHFDWFELEIGVKVHGKPHNLMPYIVNQLQRGEIDFAEQEENGFLLIKLDSGETLNIERARINRIFSSFVELNDEKSLGETNRLKLPASQLARLGALIPPTSKTKRKTKKKDAAPDYLSDIDWLSGKELAEKAQAMSEDTVLRKVRVPRELHAELRDYQQAGLNWLQFIRSHRLGGILADDMGLGKTLQTLAHILIEKKQKRLNAPCLVIAPTTLLSNWQQEAQKFAPSLKVMVLAGSRRKGLFAQLPTMDIVITSYGLVLRDLFKLRKTCFHLMVLDEAQVIKNTKSKITKTVNELRSRHRLCLTGTPMENHLGELWSLFNFLMPDFLGSEYQFNQLYRQPIEKNQDYYRQQLLAKRVAPLMLRRTKNEVATELPSKTEMTTLVELEQGQADLYETIRVSMMEQVDKVLNLETKQRNQFLIGNALLKLRQVCCHTNLIKLESAQALNISAKVEWLKTRLPNMVEQGRRILLFSSFTSMLDILAKEIEAMGFSYLMLTGKTKNRGDLVKQFQSTDIPLFLISLKAGGVGLNLTAADTVIHYDPWWNPAAEQQANDRAYRIGQDKPVFVYKLICKGTVEEKIQQMQQQKNKLAQGLYDQEALDTMNLTTEDWQALFQPIEGF